MNLHKNHWLLFTTILGTFVALSVVIAVSPAIWVQDHSGPLPGSKPPTKLQQEGLQIYISEGCVACHTQQVRPLAMDSSYGRPSAPGDYAYDRPFNTWQPYAPAVLGSERTGPDLSDIGTRQPSATWQYLHLYDPRAVAPQSVMPAFHWLFKTVPASNHPTDTIPVPTKLVPPGMAVVPTQRAKALVAYLLSLKQVPIPGTTGVTTSEKAPAPVASTNPSPPASLPDGATLYTSNCAACHQADGQGLPGAFPPLAGDPVVTAKDPTRHIEVVLNGLQGKPIDGNSYSTEMPAFAGKLSDAEIAAIIDHERTNWGNDAPTVTPSDVAAQRKATP